VIWLARHGETDYNAQDRFQGQGDVPLNKHGLRQAEELARVAAQREWAALYASPILRARQTAEVVAEAVGLAPRFDARLAETDTGDWTDCYFSDVQRDHPEMWAKWRAGGDWAFPGGESLATQQERVLAALADIRLAAGLPALVVCHRGTIRTVLCNRDGRGLGAFHESDVANGELVVL